MVALNPSRPRRKPSRRNLEIYAQVKIRDFAKLITRDGGEAIAAP